MLSFKVLGPLEVLNDGARCTPTAPRVLSTLAILLLRVNRVVPLSLIVEELWGDNPPRSAATTAQTYIYQLRRLVDEQRDAGHGKEFLATRAPGYVLHCSEDRIDLSDFRRLTSEAHAHVVAGRPEAASQRLRSALAMWSGSPLANVETGPVLEGYLASLEEQRMRALDLRIEADLQLGRVHDLVEELRSLVVEHPYNEWYHSLLVFSLARIGRRHDAMQAYDRTKRILSQDLGLSPSRELLRIIQEVVLHDRDIRPPFPMRSSNSPRTA